MLVTKTYEIELKLLFFAFKIRVLGSTIIQVILVNYLLLFEAYMQPKEDEDVDRPTQLLVNPIVPLKCLTTHIV
jgi:hypothetical protein